MNRKKIKGVSVLGLLLFLGVSKEAIATPLVDIGSLQEPHIVPLATEPIGSKKIAQTNESESESRKSPLFNQQFQFPTAEQLSGGDFVFKFTNRVFFLPESRDDQSTAVYPDFGFTWGITDSLQITFDAQLVDSGSPGVQGEFEANRKPEGGGDFNDFTIEAKQRLWSNSSGTNSLSGVISLSWGNRGYKFVKDGVTVDQGEDSNIVPALALPFTISNADSRFRFTISPTVAFFPEDSALYLHIPPIENPGSFGTTFGFTGALSYQVSERIILWGDAFIPVTGNNSISRETGKPAQTVAYNAGLRYLVNPRLGVDLFATNTLGNTGALALTADRNFTAFGTSLVFMPDFIGANSRYADSFEGESLPDTRYVASGIGFFDGGTTPSGRFRLDLQGGSQGFMTALRFGVLKDLELGAYLDYISGDVDESEQGINGKIRLLNQQTGAPFTLSLAATLSQTNQPFVNFINDNKNEFQERNLDKELPFIFNTDSRNEGRLYIVTLSLPFDYQFGNGASVWFTPVWGYVQRLGTEIAGFNVGGAIPVFNNFNLIGEVGANLVGDGNAFIGNRRENVIPWTVAVRWSPSDDTKINPLAVELYVTNRVGSSTWQQLRVRDQNEVGVGVGVSIPF